MHSTMGLLVATVALGGVTLLLGRRLRATAPRWRRPLAFVTGGLAGLAVAMPLAVVLNPFVGIQRGTFHNQMLLALCLGFLGFIIGSLGGLAGVGMIHSHGSRIKQDSFDQELASLTGRPSRKPDPEAPRAPSEAPRG